MFVAKMKKAKVQEKQAELARIVLKSIVDSQYTAPIPVIYCSDFNILIY